MAEFFHDFDDEETMALIEKCPIIGHQFQHIGNYGNDNASNISENAKGYYIFHIIIPICNNLLNGEHVVQYNDSSYLLSYVLVFCNYNKLKKIKKNIYINQKKTMTSEEKEELTPPKSIFSQQSIEQDFANHGQFWNIVDKYSKN